jgi:hypothetical protein
MRKTAIKLASLLSIALAIAFLAPLRTPAQDEEDPPTRVARLSHVDGNVSFNPAGTDDWVAAVINRPMTTGDKLWSDNDSRAELHIGSASLRVGGTTGFNFLNLSDHAAQIQVTEGTLRVRVKRLDQDDNFEIDTPNLAFSILRPGVYRINVSESGDTTIVSVRSGEGEVTGGGQAYSVHANQTATFNGTDQLNADLQEGAYDDDFDQWCAERDHREDMSQSARYVSPDVVGYEDLDEYGGWRQVPEYGTVWFPHTTVVGWAPYRYGHWVYIAPWGYTWVEDEPWGFAPFHYGRWVVVGGVWGWVPAPAPVVGVAYVRPVYAPALVAFVGGVGFGVGVGAHVGWFPLGPREVYVPSYPVSRAYVTNINVTNTRVETTVVNNYYTNVVVNKNVNVTNVTYVNQHVNGAVTATSGAAFTSGQPVARNMVRVDQAQITHASVVATAPAAAPTKQAFLGTGAAARVQPPAALANRAVVAKTAPPPPPPSYQKQQAAIQQNGGRPLAANQYHQLAATNTQQAHANVRVAPPAKAVTPIAPKNTNTAARPGQPGGAVNNPGQPGGHAANNANRPNNPPATNPPNPPNNAPANERVRTDRPPSARPNANPPANAPANPPANAKVEQQHQQQLNDLRQRQDQERQKVEQQQVQENQRLQQQKADAAKVQQKQQQQQQQLEQLEQKHDNQQQQLQQKQAQEHNRPPANNNNKPSKEEKPPKNERPPR